MRNSKNTVITNAERMSKNQYNSSATCYDNVVRRYPALSEEEERENIQRMLAGSDIARERLIMSNQAWVIGMARKWVSSTVTLEDLVQEGMEGLTWAVNRFDCKRGSSIRAYAKCYVEERMRVFSELNRTCVKTPSRIADDMVKLNQLRESMAQKQGYEPSGEELIVAGAEKLGRPEYEIAEMLASQRAEYITTHSVNKDDDYCPSEYSTAYGTEEAADALYLRREREELLEEAVAALPDKMSVILTHSYGLFGEEKMKGDDIAHMLGLSEQAISYNKRQAEKKLQANPRLKEVFQ